MTNESPNFGRYQLLERIGAGGMGEVYRAAITGPSGFRKIVVIKKALPARNHDRRFREMFVHEGRIMGALSHRNLVQIFELGEVDGELYMCLEFIPGSDLGRIIKYNQTNNKFIEPPLAAWIARELCNGLEYVHTLCDEDDQPLHIVHRDISPQNVLVSRQGDVKLGDFGIAKSISAGLGTERGEIRGKLQYLSPEQAAGDSVGPASDLYTVGLVLYEMLTLERYIQGEDNEEILLAARVPKWRPIRLRNLDVAQSLENIVERTLRPVPEERFANAADMAKALTRFIEADPTGLGSAELQELVAEAVVPGSSEVDQVASLIDIRTGGSPITLNTLSDPELEKPLVVRSKVEDSARIEERPPTMALPKPGSARNLQDVGKAKEGRLPKPASAFPSRPRSEDTVSIGGEGLAFDLEQVATTKEAPPPTTKKPLLLYGGIAGAVLLMLLILSFAFDNEEDPALPVPDTALATHEKPKQVEVATPTVAKKKAPEKVDPPPLPKRKTKRTRRPKRVRATPVRKEPVKKEKAKTTPRKKWDPDSPLLPDD